MGSAHPTAIRQSLLQASMLHPLITTHLHHDHCRRAWLLHDLAQEALKEARLLVVSVRQVHLAAIVGDELNKHKVAGVVQEFLKAQAGDVGLGGGPVRAADVVSFSLLWGGALLV